MTLSQSKLLEVIALQSDIARLGLDLGSVMTLVAERLLPLTGADGAVVELAEGEHMVYRAVAGSAAQSLGLRVARAQSLSGLCVQQGQLLRCDDAETDPRVDRQACRRVGLRSMLVMPLNHQGSVVGVVKALSGQPAHFKPEDESLLGLLADLIAAAMFHAGQHAADDLYHRATHDALTGLANRALFMDRLRSLLAQTEREPERRGAVLLLDMDGLKPLNDSLGHRAGDAALVELARRLSLIGRVSDTVARLGGDEFALLIWPIEGVDAAQSVATRIRQALLPPWGFAGRELALSASLGFVVFPVEGVVADTLIELADQRMYADKRSRQVARESLRPARAPG
ncbi:diguanylate cyclase domain-containing protein [Inhella sp.]|uniref:diguanylate cyclase domain-containing protein n=1 Tax=Inhella sp. TaxID=1921806 RepID=UPI0035AF3FDC